MVKKDSDTMGEDVQVGMLVFYCLTAEDVRAINERRKEYAEVYRSDEGHHLKGAQVHYGNDVHLSELVPAVVVAKFPFPHGHTSVNLQCILDGVDTYWATSREAGNEPGHWRFDLPGQEEASGQQE